MLATLNTIGEHLLKGKGIWARLTTEPKYDSDKKNWVVPILFDCDANEIRLLENEKQIFEPEISAIDFRYVNTGLWGPRGKKCCVSCEPKNFNMLRESLFGKGGDKGSMLKAYNEYFINEEATDFELSLKQIISLKEKVEDFDLGKFKQELRFNKNEEAVLFYIKIKSEKINSGKIISLFELNGYEDFIIGKFGASSGKAGLDYLTGQQTDEVMEAAFSGR